MAYLKTKMVRRFKYLTACLLPFLVLEFVSAQSNPMSLLDSLSNDEHPAKDYVRATFKGTRLINFHTIETLRKGAIDFRISHRFGDLSGGADNFWGLDGPATIRLGLDYSLLDNLVVGIGRSSSHKLVDGFVKYKFVKQATNGGSWVSLVWISSLNITTEKDGSAAVNGFNKYEFLSSRLSFMHQLIVARKFSEKLSVQILPTLIHINQVEKLSDKNDIFAIPLSGRFKLTKRLAVTGEYGIRILPYVRDKSQYHNSGSIGLDLETGGHVFQLFFTNSYGINEVQSIPFTTSNWSKGQIRLGFNISRVF